MSQRAWRLPVLVLGLLPGLARCGREPGPPSPSTAEADADLDAEAAILDLEPADGTAIRGTEAWIRWRSPAPVARARLLWRRSDEANHRDAEVVAGAFLLARIPGLEPGKTYEFIAENTRGGRTVRSAPRMLSAEGGLAFDASTVEARIQRDYNQEVLLTLRNTGNASVRVAARALAVFEDLPADVVGPGSVDEPSDLSPGQSIPIRLVVAGTDATRGGYEIPVEAAGCFAVARVTVERPRFDLAFEATEPDPRTLARTVKITNRGETLSDLSVRLVPEGADARLLPAVRHARLVAGAELEVSVSPVLFLEFEALELEIECRAAGRSTKFPLKFEAPKGARLLGVRTESTSGTGSKDWYCTNRPNTCSEVPGPGGNGPEEDPEKDPSVQKARLGERLIEAASKHAGKPYGGKGPDSFDCSGLTSQAFKDVGLPDPAETGTGGGCQRMWNNLDPVEPPDVRPGDVIFFDYEKDGNQDHCGIVTEWGQEGRERKADAPPAIRWWHSSGSGVNHGHSEQNAKQVNGTWTKYKAFISGYRRAKLEPPPGTCAADAPCHEEKKE